MFITECKGYELEKTKSNTSEDFFNKSEVTFKDTGIERTFQVLYLRYFDEFISEFTPYQEEPIFEAGSRSVQFKDIVALAFLIKNPEFRSRKRVYINSKAEFSSLFKELDFEKLATIFTELENGKGFEIRSPVEFIVQPQ
ncbi:hypothetical protein J27TS8_06740 [Robertmurraya siralis]|uniref:Uncharacterized protein n=1 Tax=Robertmurraya siralis TaxID=77777 RepID=A0A920BSH5_9BACI|nr:hypothetical protein [Robertmurraya siralis]PAE22041.1 hypothetical protein CHH80_02695 [Bacillus sp. 7504-2]GIN60681.1 hypothetical protein J27TS8_06740 [Robertmurraya siralis]